MIRNILVIGAILGGVLALAAGLHQVATWREAADRAAACTAAVSPGAKLDTDPSKACPPVIATDHAQAVRARACDAAFLATPENTYGVQAACSTPVKTVHADRDVARSAAARATQDLQTERLGQSAAIARASAAATTQAERKARAAAALQAAPRGDDGLVDCDAECVRNRWTVTAAVAAHP